MGFIEFCLWLVFVVLACAVTGWGVVKWMER